MTPGTLGLDLISVTGHVWYKLKYWRQTVWASSLLQNLGKGIFPKDVYTLETAPMGIAALTMDKIYIDIRLHLINL